MHLGGIRVEPLHYELRTPLSTPQGNVTVREGFQIRLRDTGGAEGWGEALPLPSAGTEELAETGRAISDVAEMCNGQTFGLSGLLDLLEERLPHAPAARCAFDVAAHALEASLQGVALSELLGGARDTVRVEARLSGVGREKLTDAARAAVHAGYRTLLLELGHDAADDDVRSVQSVRAAVGAGIALRVCPRGAWSGGRALVILERIAELDIELVLQPTRGDDLGALRILHRQSPIAVAVDTSLATPAGREAFLAGEIAGIASVAPTLLGGLRPSLRLARRAGSVHLQSYVSAWGEGPIATRAALALATAVSDSGLAHQLPGSEALAAPEPGSPAPQRGALRLEQSG